MHLEALTGRGRARTWKPREMNGVWRGETPVTAPPPSGEKTLIPTIHVSTD